MKNSEHSPDEKNRIFPTSASIRNSFSAHLGFIGLVLFYILSSGLVGAPIILVMNLPILVDLILVAVIVFLPFIGSFLEFFLYVYATILVFQSPIDVTSIIYFVFLGVYVIFFGIPLIVNTVIFVFSLLKLIITSARDKLKSIHAESGKRNHTNSASSPVESRSIPICSETPSPSPVTASISKPHVTFPYNEPIYLIERDDGFVVRVPESKLGSFDPSKTEPTESENKYADGFVERLSKRYGKTIPSEPSSVPPDSPSSSKCDTSTTIQPSQAPDSVPIEEPPIPNNSPRLKAVILILSILAALLVGFVAGLYCSSFR